MSLILRLIMKGNSKIKLYDTRTFTAKFMPAAEIREMLKGDPDRFFIVRVEEMHRHVDRPVPPSRATNHTIMYLTAGKLFMKVGSETYTIHKDEMLIVAAGQIFSFEEYNTTKFNRGFLFHFNDTFLPGKFGKAPFVQEFGFLKPFSEPRLQLDKEGTRYAGQLLKRLHADYSRNGLANGALLQSYLLALLCEMARMYQPQSPATASAALAGEFRRLVQEYHNTKQQVTDYAALLHVTANHLNKVVKAATGKSPTRFIDEAILLEAKVLLGQTTLPVGEVAAAVGIEDASYFSRLFKKYEGMTPVGYRKKMGLR
ncbi:helix-turn-helix domain-containing protein [Puia dinghuensis]|uniref:Putative HTH-type transcriptional regulator YisR n=1 Tax=Puia dinghuensis TaxID=1792502 RepID=A0A8J2XWN5_9BACT|nr:helix-turn-helix domain-containing protein [Puia dinghuensis]GGB25103.1 putative HTH-type transcriptional regulator YisR [Puia dinghuensis]